MRFWQGPDKPLVKDVLALDFDGERDERRQAAREAGRPCAC